MLRFKLNGLREVYVDPLSGRHNVSNALAAASLRWAGDRAEEITSTGLAAAAPSAMRLDIASPAGAVLVDDSYNANPGSLNAAIDTLAAGGDSARGWCSATCANSARTPSCCTPKRATAATAAGNRRACVPSVR